MPDILASLADWSTTENANQPEGSDLAGAGIAPNLRQIQATTRAWLASAGADIAAANTVNLNAPGSTIRVTGTGTVNSFGTVAAGIRKRLQFAGACTITHNATSLIIPGGQNLVTAAGDWIEIESLGAGNWTVTSITRGAGSVATLAPAANVMPFFNASSQPALAPVTPFARSLLDDADAATARATLGVVNGPSIDGGILSQVSGLRAQTVGPVVYQMIATYVQMVNPSNGSIAVRTNVNTFAALNSLGITGRDVNFTPVANQFIHFYIIFNGTTVTGLCSAVAPPTGPTLPSGYTHWAYIGTVRTTNGADLMPTVQRGAKCSPVTGSDDLALPQTALGTPSYTLVNVSSRVPSIAHRVSFLSWANFTVLASGTPAINAWSPLYNNGLGSPTYVYDPGPTYFAKPVASGSTTWIACRDVIDFPYTNAEIGFAANLLQEAPMVINSSNFRVYSYDVPNGDA